MKKIIFPVMLAVALIFSACKNSKKTSATVAALPPPPKTDSIRPVIAEPEPKRQVYRETNPRSSDILHTKLEVNFDWTLCRMNGRATIKVKPYFYSSDMLYLNARGMEIRSLEVFEVAKVSEDKKTGKSSKDSKNSGSTEVWHKLTNSKYSYENDSLKINLGRIFPENEYYYLVVDYIAKPNELKAPGGSAAITEDKGLYFINPSGENPFKMPQIWTQGETQSNSTWFPTIDSPNERMTQEIMMTVDEKYTTLSNGSLVNTQKVEGGKRMDHWKLEEAHAPYLTMMAVGEFKKVTDTPWNGKEVSFYVEKEYEPFAKEIFGYTREMIDFYSNRLGVPYAWPKYAQIAVRDYVSGAMENTSATLHGDFMVYQTDREMIDGLKGEAVIAHELFHQWFGDLVTCESWSNLPLNEGFATYGEYLWEEFKHGRDAADYHHWQSRQGYLHSDKEVDLIRYNVENRDDMFDGFSYSKTGQVLHMLRKAVGDEAFFASLKNYLETNRNKPVEIHHLRLAFEETTGRDMNWFFNQWFLNKGRPKIKVSQSYNADAGFLELKTEQNQDLKIAPVYRLPLEVDIYVNGKAERKHIEITELKQTFSLSVSAQPQLVNFDAERQLLCDLDYKKTPEAYNFQYHTAPLYEDRVEALKALEPNISDPIVFNLFREAATGDKFHAIREYAIKQLEKTGPDRSDELKAMLINVYETDSKTKVRATALQILNKRFLNDADVALVNEKALNEKSFSICAEALQAFSKKDPKNAIARAKKLENSAGGSLIFVIANLYSTNGGEEEIPFFHNSIKKITGFDILSFLMAYAKTAKRCTSPEPVLATARDLEILGKGSGKYMKFAVQKGLKELVSAWESRESTLRSEIETARKEGKNTTGLETTLKTATETKDTLTQMHSKFK